MSVAGGRNAWNPDIESIGAPDTGGRQAGRQANTTLACDSRVPRDSDVAAGWLLAAAVTTVTIWELPDCKQTSALILFAKPALSSFLLLLNHFKLRSISIPPRV